MTGESCVFCRIVEGSLPSATVAEDPSTLAFIAREPAAEGHVLVIPKRHSRNLLDIPDEDLTRVILMAKTIAQRQRARLRCEGVSLFQANEPAGFQTVFHFHLHVVPRWKGDRVVEAWHAEGIELTRLERVARILRD